MRTQPFKNHLWDAHWRWQAIKFRKLICRLKIHSGFEKLTVDWNNFSKFGEERSLKVFLLETQICWCLTRADSGAQARAIKNTFHLDTCVSIHATTIPDMTRNLQRFRSCFKLIKLLCWLLVCTGWSHPCSYTPRKTGSFWRAEVLPRAIFIKKKKRVFRGSL